jgi:hypothetical protein
MHARMARYSFSGDPLEIARKAEDGMLPIFTSSRGFRAYSIFQFDDEIVSISAWETKEDADEANRIAGEWVTENLADRVQLQEMRIGEIHLATAIGVGTRAGAGF